MTPRTRERGAEILGVGLTCAVGLRARHAAAAVRAGLARFQESDTFDRRGQPFILARVPRHRLPDLPEGSGLNPHESTLVRLAAAAASEALQPIAHPSPRVPLTLALPEPHADVPPLVRDALCLHQLLKMLAPGPTAARTISRRRAGGLLALADALAAIERGEPYALAVAADTHDDPTLLAALDREDRVRADGVYDGFTPGEAGAAVLLAAPGTAARLGRSPLARLDAVATADEPGHRYSSEPHRGDGLAAAIRGLFSVLPAAHKARTIYASLNSESLFAKEWGVATIRNRDHLDEHARLEHPADCLGDTGAASGLLLTVLAALDQQHTAGSPTLVWAASDRELRAATLLR
jgi:3-oxoacyl-[acyl-carrier-protein] synthase-1